MRIGLISDIHGNLEALQTILARLDRERLDRLYCLGDVVGYGADPNACVELIRERCLLCILGNHDAALTGHTPVTYFNSYARTGIEWTGSIITTENLDFLRGLKLMHAEEQFMLVHATPKDPDAWNYVHDESEAAAHFPYISEGATAFIGHSHVPARFVESARRKAIINVGSVGQPRDRDPRACCGIFDTVSGHFDWVRETYDIQETARKIRAAGLPEYLAVRLFIGM